MESVTLLTGMPYVRAHGLYTGMAYAPSKPQQVLVWRAPLFSYLSKLTSVLAYTSSLVAVLWNKSSYVTHTDARAGWHQYTLPYSQKTFTAISLLLFAVGPFEYITALQCGYRLKWLSSTHANSQMGYPYIQGVGRCTR